MTIAPLPDEPPLVGGGIDYGLSAAATRAPAASREDSCSQDILKFNRPCNLDYRAPPQGLPVS